MQDVYSLVANDAVLGQRPWRLIEPGTVQSALDANVDMVTMAPGADGKVGVGGFILPIEEGVDANPSVPFGPLKLPIIIELYENTTLNNGPHGTKIAIRRWANRCRVLKLNTPVLLTNSFMPQNPCISIFQPFSMKNGSNIFENHRGAAARFWAVEADDEFIQRLNRPSIAIEGDIVQLSSGRIYIASGQPMVTLTAPGEADAIYYTMDGSPPWPGKAASADGKFKAIPSSATVYDGNAFPITAPCMLRVRSIKAGYVDSDTAAVNFTNEWQAAAPGQWPPLALKVVNGRLVPVVNDSGNILTQPFVDEADGTLWQATIHSGRIKLHKL